MNRLNLSMLPIQRYDDASGISEFEQSGFVDDAVVMALVAGPLVDRSLASSCELVLSADDLDFAGWSTPKSLPIPAIRSLHTSCDSNPRRPAPPALEESGIGEPHRGGHRWWLAGIAGALSTLIFSALLFTLSSRTIATLSDSEIVSSKQKIQSLPIQKSTPSAASVAPELTTISADP
ncbi:MAG: hypothetical protein H8M99_04045 [Gloeobacteraceae cyanobacterium ES-bin-144]|nr:hypothetical protein [Verrucomicrobiales bacterium]